MDLVLPLRAVGRADLAVAGGKGANLGELVRAGFAVPDGFVITTAAYMSAVRGIRAPSASPEAAAAVRDAVSRVAIPDDVRDGILTGYERLGRGAVAVRSSATAEDLPGAAFAGQQETFLNVRGEDEVLDAVRRAGHRSGRPAPSRTARSGGSPTTTCRSPWSSRSSFPPTSRA